MQKYEIKDDAAGALYVFTGDLLGSSDSRRRKELRWTEVYIYKTDTGKLVAHRAGCSDIFHTLDGALTESTRTHRERNCSSGRLRTSADLHEDAAPCPVCKPDRKALQTVREEEDRSSVVVADTAAELIEALTTTDAAGVRYISKTTRRALEEAAVSDPSLEPVDKELRTVTI